MENNQKTEDAAERLNLRSEEVQEIISKMPTWIVRYGITLIFAIFLSLISLSWYIRYPDVLKANIVITTNPPPLNLFSKKTGNIKPLTGASLQAERWRERDSCLCFYS